MIKVEGVEEGASVEWTIYMDEESVMVGGMEMWVEGAEGASVEWII